MYIYIYGFEKEERYRGGTMEGIHFEKGEEKKLSASAEWAATFFPPLRTQGQLATSSHFRKKVGDLDYKMESVNKRHF